MKKLILVLIVAFSFGIFAQCGDEGAKPEGENKEVKSDVPAVDDNSAKIAKIEAKIADLKAKRKEAKKAGDKKKAKKLKKKIKKLKKKLKALKAGGK